MIFDWLLYRWLDVTGERTGHAEFPGKHGRSDQCLTDRKKLKASLTPLT